MRKELSLWDGHLKSGLKRFRKCLFIEMVEQCRCECFNRKKVISEK